MSAPSIAVVVVTWNSAAQLPGLIGSLGAGLAGLRHQLIIVDNDSADDSVSVASGLAPDCTIIQTGRNAGYAAGVNAGLAAAQRYDAALVLNPDIRLSPGCVATLYAELPAPPTDRAANDAGGVDGTGGVGGRVGIVVPLIRDEDGSVALSMRREPSIPRAFGEALLGQRAGRIAYFGETVLDGYLSPRDTAWATGATMLISAECAAACGPWNESFFLYSEETEFALRARDRGYRTRYVPAAEVTHLGGESRVSPKLWSLLTVNRVRLYRMRHSAPATALFWSAIMLREASRAALGHARSRSAVKALLRGTGNA